MKNVRCRILAFGCLTLMSCLPVVAADWLQFRGTAFSGASDAQTVLPITNGDESSIAIAWQVPTAARGISSPIVVGDQVIVTSSGGQDERDLYIESFAAGDGSRNWVQTLHALGRPYTHPTSANAGPSPASDGTHIVALYSSCELVCLKTDGSPVWFRALAVDHPLTGNDISMSSSPTIIGQTVVAQLENQGDSFVTGIDLSTGRTLWEHPRPKRSGWASPIGFIMPPAGDGPTPSVHAGVPVVACQNASGLEILSARTGERLQEISLSASTTSSPTFASPFLIVPGDGLVALDLSQADCPVVWENSRVSVRNASPVVRGDRIYASKGSVLAAANLADGDMVWQERLPDINSVWATPVATASGVYVVDQSGILAVATESAADQDPQILGPAKLDGPVLASPAVAGNAIFVRADRALIKLAPATTP